MNIAVALLTCDRYEYTVKTVEALKQHNDVSRWPLFYADDHSQDEQVRPYVESQGFRPLVLNDGERVGCSAISDGLLQAVLAQTGPDWFVLYLQNDFTAIRPLPMRVISDFFSVPQYGQLRMYHNTRFWMRKQRHGWRTETYGGEDVTILRTCAWPVSVSRLAWFAGMVKGVRREKTIHLRAKRAKPAMLSGVMHERVFGHCGRRRTPGGIFRSAAAWS